MRIAFLHKGTGYGGTDHQAELLKDELRRLGYIVDHFTKPTDLSVFDIAVLLHLNIPDTKDFYLNCKAYNKPYVVKTIWSVWDALDFVYQIAQDASVLFCESPKEKTILIEKLSRQVPNVAGKIKIVLPAVDPVFKDVGKPVNERRLVHCNGRYVPKKRMLDVLCACKDLNLPVSVSGYPQVESYYKECLDVGYGKVLGELGKSDLCDLLNETRLYATASEIEICSASVSEAIACGCKVLSSDRYHPGNSNFTRAGYFTYDGSDENLKDALKEAYCSDCSQENVFWTPAMLADSYHKVFLKVTKKLKFL